MSIANLYRDKIMGGLEGDPLTNISNKFATSGPGIDQGFTNQFNLGQRFDPMFYSDDQSEIPGFNFIDAPIETSFFKRITDPTFQPYRNNPRTGVIDNFILSKGNPNNNIKNKITTTVGKGFDLGKAAFGGLLSLASGIPGLGLILNLFEGPSPQQEKMMELYNSPEYQEALSKIPGMENYNPIYGGGAGYGLTGAIDKRIERIQKTLKKKDSEVLKKRLKDLQDLRAIESAVDFTRIGAKGRRPTPGDDKPGVKDTAASKGIQPGKGGGADLGGGYSYDAGGRKGFGFGLKKGGLAGLL